MGYLHYNKELVKKWKEGDHEAAELLWKMLEPGLILKFYQYTSSIHDIQDLLHETFIKMALHLHSLRDESSFPAWVEKIASNLIYDFFKERKKTIAFQKRYSQFQEYKLEKKEEFSKDSNNIKEVKNLLQCIERLSKEEQKMIFLRYYENKTLQQIAEIYSITAQAMDKRFKKIFNKLSCMLKNYIFEE